MKLLKHKADFIWLPHTAQANDIAVFRREFSLDFLPPKAEAIIAAETRYYLWLNGNQVIYEGGLLRESAPDCGWADVVDLAPYLKKGDNLLVIWVYYYGNGGRNNKRLDTAGLMLDCPALELFSDENFLCRLHPAFYTPGEPKPSYLYGGNNLGLDARMDSDSEFSSSEGFVPAVRISGAPFGKLYQRPIPQFRLEEEKKAENITIQNELLTADLPYAMMTVPVLYVEAKGGEKIDVRTDRWNVFGGPATTNRCFYSNSSFAPLNHYGFRLEFICKPGWNRLESLIPLYGEKLVIRAESGASIRKIGYRETGYDCDITGSFHSSQPLLDTLVKKAARTLYVCMRDNFMDCPDRERGQWIGDISVQVPQAAFLLDDRAMLLVKKAIHDFVVLRKGDILMGNVPGEHSSELPSQSLAAISEWGLAAQYWKYSGDRETLALLFQPAVRYLALWKLDEDGLLVLRPGNWQWYDHLHNQDGPVIENAWYLSALKFVRRMSDILNDHSADEFLESRITSISQGFEKKFWKKNRYASEDRLVDDRANALAVLSGACPPERYPAMRIILLEVFNATVYMENFVLTALCEMGYFREARDRMLSRYYNLAVNENSTLWEDFYILGSRNHGWSGAPATLAFRYFLGVDIDADSGRFTVNPCWDLFDWMEGSFLKNGKIIRIRADSKIRKVTIE